MNRRRVIILSFSLISILFAVLFLLSREAGPRRPGFSREDLLLAGVVINAVLATLAALNDIWEFVLKLFGRDSRTNSGDDLEAAWRETDREIALEHRRQNILDDYLSRMTDLILTNDLGPEAKQEVKRIAKSRTLILLRELDGARNRQVIQFLRDSELIGPDPVLDLSKSDLHRANLTPANLSGVNLSHSDLSRAYLFSTKLNGALLMGASLKGAVLDDADLSYADLSDAVHWTEPQLLAAKSLTSAIMPDGSRYEDWIQRHSPQPPPANDTQPPLVS